MKIQFQVPMTVCDEITRLSIDQCLVMIAYAWSSVRFLFFLHVFGDFGNSPPFLISFPILSICWYFHRKVSRVLGQVQFLFKGSGFYSDFLT